MIRPKSAQGNCAYYARSFYRHHHHAVNLQISFCLLVSNDLSGTVFLLVRFTIPSVRNRRTTLADNDATIDVLRRRCEEKR